MQAAIGRIQCRRLPQWRAQRSENATALTAALQQIPALRVPQPSADMTHTFYRLYAQVELNSLEQGWTRDRIIAEVGTHFDVPIFSGSCSEIYREKAFIDAGLVPAAPLQVASQLTDTTFAFLVHPGLTPADMAVVAGAVADVLADATASTRAQR